MTEQECIKTTQMEEIALTLHKVFWIIKKELNERAGITPDDDTEKGGQKKELQPDRTHIHTWKFQKY